MDRPIRAGILAVLAVSLLLNLLLREAFLRQRDEAVRFREALVRMQAAAQLRAGQRVPPFLGEDVVGEDLQITFGSAEPTLLYVFSPDCGWCQRNVGNIRELGRRLAKSHRVLGIALPIIEVQHRQAEVEALGFPVLFNPSQESVADYRLGGTPQTLLISPEGKVVKIWTGAFAGSLEREIEGRFQVSLPGLAEPLPARSGDPPRHLGPQG